MERKDKIDAVKAFLKTYWKELAFPALGAGIFVGLLTNRRKKSSPKFEINNHFGLQPFEEEIEMEIFTDLAPMIENAVLIKSIKKAEFDRSYELDDLTKKLVTVTVETINGD